MVNYVKEAKACTSETITWTVAYDQIEIIVESLKEHFPRVTYSSSVDWDDETMYRLRCVLNR